MDKWRLFFNYFLEGYSSIVNGLFPNDFNSDAENLTKDWEHVGFYINNSINIFESNDNLEEYINKDL